MAQGAWKDWSEGELVTEALFQDIQDSIAFIFASESAANSALTRKVEGTQFYDTGADALKVWTGSAWAEVGTSGLNLVANGTFSTVTGFNVDGCFTSEYRNYKIIVDGVGDTSNVEELRIQMRASGSTDTTGNTDWSVLNIFYIGGAGHSVVAALDSAYFEIVGGFINASAFSTEIEVITPQVSARTQMMYKLASHYNDSEYNTATGGGVKDETTAFDGFRIFTVGSQTLSGTYKVYGYRNS